MGNTQIFGGASCAGSGAVGALGAVDGLLAMSGLSGANNPIFRNDDGSGKVSEMQQNIQDEMRTTETTLGNMLVKLTDAQEQSMEWSLSNLQKQQMLTDLKQDEKIETNYILVMGLLAALAVLFVYDIIA